MPDPAPGATTVDGSTSGAMPMPDDDGDESSSSGNAPLDAGMDSPSPECASISQSTQIVERPSDIIVIADDGVSREFLQDNITNLLPGMETEQVFDARVVLVASGDAPPVVEDDKYACGEWNCRGASTYADFTVFDRTVSPTAALTDLLAAEDDWRPLLREDAWRHVWVMASADSDDSLTPEAFLEAVGGNLIVHAVVTAEGKPGSDGYAALAEMTGGAYSQGDYNLFDFQDPMIERIQGTALACEYTIPEPPDGLVFARDKVNVLYDEGDGALPIGYVETASECLVAGYGWHYDDPVAPSEIVMCPESCERFEALTNATIDIEFGCDTIPAA